MRSLAPLAVPLLALVALAPTAESDWYECNSIVLPSDVVDLSVAYVALDYYEYTGQYVPWIYLETNGLAGLQRGGITLLGDEDICHVPGPHDQGVL